MDERGVPVGSESSAVATVRWRSASCDRCGGGGVWRGGRCPTCEGSGRREWSPFELRVELSSEGDREEAFADAIDRRDLAGDYAVLERALADLRGVDVGAWRAWTGRFLFQLNGSIVDEDAVERGWAFVLARMPERPRVPGFVREAETRRRSRVLKVKGRTIDARALAQRDQEIRRLHREGLETVQGLVRLTGLSRSQVYDVLSRVAAD